MILEGVSMNILMIVTWYGKKNDSFTGNFHYELACALQKKHNVALFFPFDKTIKGIEYDYEDGLLTFRSNNEKRRLEKVKKIYNDIKYIHNIFKPDVIHAHVVSGAGSYALLAKMIFGVPYILTEHAPLEMMNLSKKNICKTKFILKKSYANIAVSTDLQNKLNSIYIKANFQCIYNGVIDPYTIIGNYDKIYRKKDCLNAIIMCGFYSKTIKGLQFLFPAIKKVNEGTKKIHLHICGGGKYLGYYISLAKQINIENDITFYDMCDKSKMYSILNQMDFSISCSLFESAGVSVEESCMMGKPQLITKSGGANSLIPDEYCIKVERGSTEALVNGLFSMIKSYNLFDKDLIIKYGYNNFEMEKICRSYEELYSKAITTGSI